jgi:inner membrane protein
VVEHVIPSSIFIRRIELLLPVSYHAPVRMSPITHFLMGWAVANMVPSLTKRERAFVTLASVVPDIDGLGIIAEKLTQNSSHPLNWWSDYHHILGHNIGFALLVSVVAAAFGRQKLKVLLLVFLSFHLHLIGDLVGARGPDGDQWPIPYLLPFSNHMQLTWSGQWALNAWPNMVVTAALIATTVVLARVRGFSPLEMFSAKADTAFVRALRNRFPVRSSN